MKQKYVFIYEREENEDGSANCRMHSENDGFNPLEILGMLEWKRDDVIRQMRGELKPTVVERNLIKDEQDGGAE